jgi:hypothetical protein
MIRKIFAVATYFPFAIMLVLAIVGAVVALVGGLAGWEAVRTSGGTMAGVGALGFFGWFFVLAWMHS